MNIFKAYLLYRRKGKISSTIKVLKLADKFTIKKSFRIHCVRPEEEFCLSGQSEPEHAPLFHKPK